jgi:hypothetical protein
MLIIMCPISAFGLLIKAKDMNLSVELTAYTVIRCKVGGPQDTAAIKDIPTL